MFKLFLLCIEIEYKNSKQDNNFKQKLKWCSKRYKTHPSINTGSWYTTDTHGMISDLILKSMKNF